jgi:hypothetical protein
MDVQQAVVLVEAEYSRVTGLFDGFNTAHEGYALLLEEIDELWVEVKRKPRSAEKMRKEAVQVAAMAIRFLVDIC